MDSPSWDPETDVDLPDPQLVAADDAMAWRRERLRSVIAVRAEDWVSALAGFERALALAEAEDDRWRSGLEADAAFCLWLEGHRIPALARFARALEGLTGSADAAGTQRLSDTIGLILATLNRLEGGERVPDEEQLWPGVCSDSVGHAEHPAPDGLTWLQLLRLEERLGGSDLHARHHHHPESSASPLVRWYSHRLMLRKSVRTGALAGVMPVVVACGRAFRALRQAPQADPTDALLADSPAVLEMETLAYAVIPSLMACVILLAGQGEGPAALIDDWVRALDPTPGETALLDWLRGAASVVGLPAGQAWDLIREMEQSLDLRVLAGTRLLAAPSALPNHVFFAHCLITLWAARRDTTQGEILLQEGFPHQMATTWLGLSERRVVLNMPGITAPAIAQACAGPVDGWRAVRRILLAARTAVDVPLSTPVLDALVLLIDERPGDPLLAPDGQADEGQTPPA